MKALYVLTASLVLAGPAYARARVPHADAPPPKELDTVLGCRTIPSGAERLACYDRGVDSLQAATAKHDIIVVDRETVRRTRRSLFGYNLPADPLLGGVSSNGQAGQEEREINATVRSARVGPDGLWIVILDDGAVWHQTDGTLALSPKPGNNVLIRRASLGSYFMRINNQPGVKARREG